MKYKYLIPLVLCGLMIAMVAPAYASDVGILSAQSRLDTDNIAKWTSNSSYQEVNFNSGDHLNWYDFKHHYCSYAPSQNVKSYIKYSGNTYTATEYTLGYRDSYGTEVSWQLWGDNLNVVRTHKYMSSNTETDPMTTRLN
ncbi:hypothetical protein RCIA130 [Methanocella arvoryzae MRE50]|uniref:Uncharacterized protein n=1 Tax=Methanocella arvoryzae (strain DSM 22066 / NBRC 105507 / MRE50) TaxID=351160 RepID=Q0W463_METAR|nr:hypothetical protein RCIA130 [Methanocella arvoryzae MRE50]